VSPLASEDGPDLVIFDCDGVLIDSEVIACRIDAEELTRVGYPISSAEVVARFAGVTARETYATVEAELGRPLPAGFSEQVRARIAAAFETELVAIPGARAALTGLGRPVCVASSSGPEKLAASLRLVGLYDLVAPHVFSARAVGRGKPAPDLFLHAAAQRGVEPQRCLVIEDSVAGVTGARLAGMTAFGFHGASHCGPDHAEALQRAGAARLFADMRRLPALIAGWESPGHGAAAG
jgi:HAD superfamily hydrolase (TIGR01509 family)